jgi:uncharacterized protein YsxB (DUF464 family)
MKRRFPRFTCSGVNVIDFVEFNGIVRVASSSSIAQEFVKVKVTIEKKDKKLINVLEKFIVVNCFIKN